MKSTHEIQAAIDELTRVCVKHGVVLRGMSLSEGVGGEIAIVDASDSARIGTVDDDVLHSPHDSQSIDHWVSIIGKPL